MISESTATVEALLSAALVCLLNFVRQEVVQIVNAVYAIMVTAVIAANFAPYCHVRMPQTMEISSAVGNTWKTMLVRRKLIPFVPRSMARVRPPVCLER